MRLLEAWQQIERPRILVVGDLILDRYTTGVAGRVSQESPVIVLHAQGHEHRLGGAASVSHMLAALGAQAACAGVTGADPAGATIRQLLDEAGIDSHLVLADSNRPSTVKERFVGRSGSSSPAQILRVDTESTMPLATQLERRLTDGIRALAGRLDAILISDYAKGVCTPGAVRAAIEFAAAEGIPVLVDPGRGVDVGIYQGSTVLKPNRSETEWIVGRTLNGPEDAISAAQQVCQQFGIQNTVVTLDKDGMVLADEHGRAQVFPTQARSVYDITGAGDMVLAVLGLACASGLPLAVAVPLANLAANLEVDRPGVAVLSRDEVAAAIRHDNQSGRKLISLDQAQHWADHYHAMGKTIVLTNGCFDLLHVGHVTYLSEASAMGDVLFVGINSDASVTRLKGAGRPIIPQADRAALLAALECVGHVVVFDEDTPHRLIRAVRPDVLVKGGTYQPHEVVGHELVESYGGRVCVTGLVSGISTTNIVRSVQYRAAWRQAG